MIDDNTIDVNVNIDTNPTENSCLICGQVYQVLTDFDKSTIQTSNRRFQHLCQGFRVTIAKDLVGWWNFEEEQFPGCTSCIEIIDRLGIIVEHVAKLEEEYSSGTRKLKDKLISFQEQNGTSERVNNFRKLVLGHVPPRKRGRPTKNRKMEDLTSNSLSKKKPSLDYVLSNNADSIRIANALQDTEHQLGFGSGTRHQKQDRPKRKSTKSSRRKLFQVGKRRALIKKLSGGRSRTAIEDVEDDALSIFSIQNAVKQETVQDEQFLHSDIAPKLEVQIKQEVDLETEGYHPSCQSEDNNGFSAEDVNEDEDDTPLAQRMANKIQASRVVINTGRSSRRQARRKSYKIISDLSDDDNDSDPDFDVGQAKSKNRVGGGKFKKSGTFTSTGRKTDGSNSDEETDSSEDEDADDDFWDESCEVGDARENSVRKWKIDKKKGRMWYKGIEVILQPTGLQCSICLEGIEGDKSPKHRLKMKYHIITKHLANFVCPLCNKKLTRQKYLDMHIQMVHEKTVKIPCNICEKPFTSTNAMRRHSWSHQSEEEKKLAIASGKKRYSNGSDKLETVQCGTCGKICRGAYNLKKHEETHLDIKERQKHMCQICGAIYSAAETLRQHIKLNHENNDQLQWLQCPHCPKKYPQHGLLGKHMRVHTGEKPFTCEKCGAGFSNTNLLKVHVMKHNNIRPHQCEYCEMAFYRNYHLARHTNTYHLNPSPPKKKQPYRSENGTRKPPQKRDRRSGVHATTTIITTIPSVQQLSGTLNPEQNSSRSIPHYQNQTQSDNEDNDTNESDSPGGGITGSSNIPLTTGHRHNQEHDSSGNFAFTTNASPGNFPFV